VGNKLPNACELVLYWSVKMTAIVDEVGRMVLPKKIRQAIGVSGRTPLQIEEVDNAARITAPKPLPRATARWRGRLVYTGSLPEKWDSGRAVLEMRPSSKL
jgi:hypothetical protein